MLPRLSMYTVLTHTLSVARRELKSSQREIKLIIYFKKHIHENLMSFVDLKSLYFYF